MLAFTEPLREPELANSFHKLTKSKDVPNEVENEEPGGVASVTCNTDLKKNKKETATKKGYLRSQDSQEYEQRLACCYLMPSRPA